MARTLEQNVHRLMLDPMSRVLRAPAEGRGAPPRPLPGQTARPGAKAVVRAPGARPAPGAPAGRPAPKAPPPPLPDDLELDFSEIFGGDLLAQSDAPPSPKPVPKPAAPVVAPPPRPAARPAPSPAPAVEEDDLASLLESIPQPPPLPPVKPQPAPKPAAVAKVAPAPAKPRPAAAPPRAQTPASAPRPAPRPAAPAAAGERNLDQLLGPPQRPGAVTAMGGEMSSPKGKSKALAETVIGSLCERLVQETKRKGGTLTLADVERLTAEFWRKTESLQAVFEKSFEDYVRARERAATDQTRNYPFDRVIVREFEHLFAGPGQINNDRLSRRMLPGFFMAMNKMLGEEVVEDYQERCRKIVRRVRDARGPAFKWPDVYEDRDAKALVIDSLVTIAGYFQDLEKRSAWFLTIVNNHLAPPPPNASSAVAEWQLSPAGFRLFLRALFRALRDELKAPQGRTRITERYGIESCLAVTETVDQVFSD